MICLVFLTFASYISVPYNGLPLLLMYTLLLCHSWETVASVDFVIDSAVQELLFCRI